MKKLTANKKKIYILVGYFAFALVLVLILIYLLTPFIIKQFTAWPTYTDTQYKYSIQYPPQWQKGQNGFFYKSGDKVLNIIVLLVADKDIQSAHNEYAHPTVGKIVISDTKKEKVKGKEALKLSSTSSVNNASVSSYEIFVAIQPNKTLILSSSSPENKDAMNYMVSTINLK